MMRYFFGLEPDGKTKLAIEQWREQNFAVIQGKVPMVNFHITLAFLGQLEAAQLNQLYQNMDHLEPLSRCAINLDQVGYWPKPKALWLGAQHTETALSLLVKTLTRIAHQSHINLQKRPYIPHLTLFRKCSENPPAGLIQAEFICSFEQYHLFESVSTSQGVSYQRRGSWPLL